MEAPTPADSSPHRPRKGGRKPGPVAEKQRHVVSVGSLMPNTSA